MIVNKVSDDLRVHNPNPTALYNVGNMHNQCHTGINPITLSIIGGHNPHSINDLHKKHHFQPNHLMKN